MKKIFFGVLIVTLPILVFFQYNNYKRFHPPTNYEYLKSESIDIYYHDAKVVEEYFEKIVSISAFARRKWRNEGIDVRFPDDSEKEKNVANLYNFMLSRVKEIETILEKSAKLKEEGFDNEQIIQMEKGISKTTLKWTLQKTPMLNAVLGDRGEHIWNIQKLLIGKGYEHNLDGVFGMDTQNALLAFQRDNQIYPSGIISETTFNLLVK